MTEEQQLIKQIPFATRGKRPRVQVSIQEKESAIRRIRNGETKAGISRELGVPESTVRGWVKRADLRLMREREQGTNANAADANKNLTIGTTSNDKQYETLQAVSSKPPMINQATNAAISMDLAKDDNVLHWLNVFNAGLLSFTFIASAASMQGNMNGDTRDLWSLIEQYVTKNGASINSIQLFEPVIKSQQYEKMQEQDTAKTLAQVTVKSVKAPSACKSQSKGGQAAKARGTKRAQKRPATIIEPKFHITASDEEDDKKFVTEQVKN